MLAVVNNGTSNHSEKQQSQYQIIAAFCSSHPASKAHALYYALIYGLSGSTMFFQIISQMAGYSKKSYLTHNVCVDFLYNFYQKHFSSLQEFSVIS